MSRAQATGVRVPPRGEGVLDGQLVGASGFLSGLPSAVPTMTWLVLWHTDRSAIPVHPRGLEMRDFTGTDPESPGGETDESRLEVVRLRQCRTRFQEEFELAVGEDVFVGVSGGECLSVTCGPLGGRLVVM